MAHKVLTRIGLVSLGILVLIGVIIFDVTVWNNLFSSGNDLGRTIGYGIGCKG